MDDTPLVFEMAYGVSS